MVEGFKQGMAIFQLADTIEPHGIEPLEDVVTFPVLRGVTVLLDEALNLLEAGDDPFLAGRPASLLRRLDFDAKLLEKCIVLFGEFASHAQRPPSCGPG